MQDQWMHTSGEPPLCPLIVRFYLIWLKALNEAQSLYLPFTKTYTAFN